MREWFQWRRPLCFLDTRGGISAIDRYGKDSYLLGQDRGEGKLPLLFQPCHQRLALRTLAQAHPAQLALHDEIGNIENF